MRSRIPSLSSFFSGFLLGASLPKITTSFGFSSKSLFILLGLPSDWITRTFRSPKAFLTVFCSPISLLIGQKFFCFSAILLIEHLRRSRSIRATFLSGSPSFMYRARFIATELFPSFTIAAVTIRTLSSDLFIALVTLRAILFIRSAMCFPLSLDVSMMKGASSFLFFLLFFFFFADFLNGTTPIHTILS